LEQENTMSTMLRWSPTQHFHLHHELDQPSEGLAGATVTAPATPSSWVPAAEGRIEADAYVIQLSLAGVDPKDVVVSLMDNVLTVKGERKTGHDGAGKDYFVREVAYGTFQREFALPEGVDAAGVEAKYTQGMLEMRVPKPLAATPRTIEIKAA